MSLRTIRGQEIVLYPASATVQTEKREHGRTYRLCQVMPPLPQRFEWIRLDNIREIPSEERDRLRRTARPRASSKVESQAERPAQDQNQSRKAA